MAPPSQDDGDFWSGAGGGDAQIMLEVVFSGKDNKKQSGVCMEKCGFNLALQVTEGTKPATLLLGRTLHRWARMSAGEML